MKTLVVMRHGKAMPPAQNQEDAQRSLTKAGSWALDARLPHMLSLLQTRGAAVQIWTSPARRARQTAKLLEKALKERDIPLDAKIETHDCLLRQDVDKFLTELRNSEAEFVIAVGHVPFAEDVVTQLVGSTPPFGTGALGCVEVDFANIDSEGSSPAQVNARFLWFVQGPDPARWETLISLQESITKTAEEIEKRREAFFANPADTHAIHRFRTYTRSLRSQIAFIKPWQNAKQNTETQAILKEIVGYTSLLRELDVFEKQARSNPDSSPELLELCAGEACDERAKVLKILSSKRTSRLFKKAMQSAKNVTWKRRYAKYGLPKSEVRARFDNMVASVQADLDALQLSDEERTHDVRKRAKRARYVSEVNDDVLGTDAVDIAKGMMAHQDNLGDICDARANIRLIGEYLERDLPKVAVWELNLMRAQNETFLYGALRSAAIPEMTAEAEE